MVLWGAQNFDIRVYDTRAHSHLQVALPYPVGVTSVANFTRPQGGYKVPVRRRISVLFAGRYDKTDFRKFLHDQFWQDDIWHNHGKAEKFYSYKCRPGQSDENMCGLPKNISDAYTAALNSDFCLEPTGDTPTRSHFYLAVMLGCIPVIFDYDKGHLYDGNEGLQGCLWSTVLSCIQFCIYCDLISTRVHYVIGVKSFAITELHHITPTR